MLCPSLALLLSTLGRLPALMAELKHQNEP